jgi:hypothetical protein
VWQDLEMATPEHDVIAMRVAWLFVVFAACDQGAKQPPEPVREPPAPTAQPEPGGVRGTVIASGNSPVPNMPDPPDELVPGATVTAKDAKGGEHTAKTDDGGHYELSLPPGSYTLAVPTCDATYSSKVQVTIASGAWSKADLSCWLNYK